MLYNIGQDIIITIGTDTEAGTPADATAGTLQIEDPDGTIVATVDLDDLEHVATGSYEHTYNVPGPAGRWHYRFAGTAGLVAVGEGSFHVRRSNFT